MLTAKLFAALLRDAYVLGSLAFAAGALYVIHRMHVSNGVSGTRRIHCAFVSALKLGFGVAVGAMLLGLAYPFEPASSSDMALAAERLLNLAGLGVRGLFLVGFWYAFCRLPPKHHTGRAARDHRPLERDPHDEAAPSFTPPAPHRGRQPHNRH